MKDLTKQDLIIIPALHEMNNYGVGNNQKLIEWITNQYEEGSELASLCTGAFFLAATGLLKNMECSTHFRAEESFTKIYPDVKLRIDKIITDSKGIYTAGGASSTLNLIIYLIEKYNGRETAIYCAKILQIDMERTAQSMFIMFEGQRKHDDNAIKEIQSLIELKIEEKISVESLPERFNISKRSLVRRFKKATNNAPIEYIQRLKIEGAKRDLEMKNVNEIMYSVGYTDVKAFRTIFKKITGLSPIEYRNKYNKDF
jgi:transcriptional regulator GlxA family with amidase domain